MRELDLTTLENADPVASAYYRDVGKSQISMTDAQEIALLEEYDILRRGLHEAILSDISCVGEVFLMYEQIVSEGRSVAKLSNRFNSKKSGHNKKISKKIRSTFDRLKTNSKYECNRGHILNTLLELGLSDDCYKKLLKYAKENESGIVVRAEVYNKQLRGIEDKLVRTALKAARDVAKKYASSVFGIDEKDAIQEANLALIEAVQKYNINYRTDIGNRVKFITYAYSLADRRVKEWIMENSRLVRLPRSKLDLIFVVLEAYNKLKEDTGIEVLTNRTNELLEERRGRKLYKNELLSVEDISEAIELLQGNCLQLDHPFFHPDKGSKARTLSDIIPDDKPTPDEVAEKKSESKKIISNLKRLLNPMEYQVISLRYMQDSGRNTPYEIVSQMLIPYLDGKKLSRERIRQIEYKALRKLKKEKKAFR